MVFGVDSLVFVAVVASAAGAIAHKVVSRFCCCC